MDDAIRSNAEARWRAGAGAAWRIALFLFALLAGALLWSVVLAPLLDPALRNAGADAAGRTVLRAAVVESPALFLAFAAWQAMGVLRRFARGRARLAGNARSIAVMGAATALAGAMSVFGAPTLLTALGAGLDLRFAFTAQGFALLALGGILALAGRALREG